MSTDATLFDSAFLAKLEQLHLLAKRIFRGSRRAERRSRQIGASLEFADYREYAPGDEPRTIDWNAYGRLERLFVKLYEQEQDLPVHFLVDCSASMRRLPDESEEGIDKFGHARRLCAALAYIALANLDRVNIHFFARHLLTELGVARGKSEFHSVLRFLSSPPVPDGPTSLLDATRTLVGRARRPGLAFVMSDFFDPAGYGEALSVLTHSRFEVHVIQVLSTAELSPQALGDLRLTEIETGQSMSVTVNDRLLRRYREEIAAFNSALENFCLRRGIASALVTTDAPFEDVVLRVLRDGVMVR